MNPFLFYLLLVFLTVPSSTASSVTNKLDRQEFVVPQEPYTGIKSCGSCPCVNPCPQLHPPPPPPPPPPPKTIYCTPVAPPPPRFVYVTGVPENGNLYVTEPSENWYYFGGAAHNAVSWLMILAGAGFGLLHLMVFW